MASENYEPEVGQAIFGSPTGKYAVPDYAESLVFGVLREFDRVYWNIHQKAHEDTTADLGGVSYRAYWWGDQDAPGAALPNLAIDGDDVEVRWYKYPGRGMSVNRSMTPSDWIKWHDVALTLLREHYRKVCGW